MILFITREILVFIIFSKVFENYMALFLDRFFLLPSQQMGSQLAFPPLFVKASSDRSNSFFWLLAPKLPQAVLVNFSATV